MKRLKELMEDWQDKLGLQNYDIMWSIVDDIEDYPATADSYCHAITQTWHKTLSARVQFNRRVFTDPVQYGTEAELSVLVAHELSHVMVNESVGRVFEDMLELTTGALPEVVRQQMFERFFHEGERLVRILEVPFGGVPVR